MYHEKSGNSVLHSFVDIEITDRQNVDIRIVDINIRPTLTLPNLIP
jgi:hypothetical protein